MYVNPCLSDLPYWHGFIRELCIHSFVTFSLLVYDHASTYNHITQVRARTFYAEKKNLNVADVDVPVVGGHAGITILPLFSQAIPNVQMSHEEIDQLTKRTQDGGTEVVQAKAGNVSKAGNVPLVCFHNEC